MRTTTVLATPARARSVTRELAAAPQQIFAVLRDPARHAALDGSGMLRGHPDGPALLGPGDRFGMAMAQAGLAYRSVNVVVEYAPDRLIAWETWGEFRGRRLVGGQRWRFALHELSAGDGSRPARTRVTHTYDWSRARLSRLTIELPGYPRRMVPAMVTTLDRLAAAVEDRQAGSGPGAGPTARAGDR
ncbi:MULTISPECIES: SRPBCC family protein [Streptomyces]|uniref:SRPBCC family protein n=1 Tax=Streptomyces TaxID=1883 RepID=UPI0019641CB6|nr:MULTISPECIES: SRPBCC family protein [Streptomyces]QRX93841.1 SRPBCC family protein [Streptomyces noursei]UJB43520.1 SRPBCC family protein [Streptomyces sp. A1-5]